AEAAVAAAAAGAPLTARAGAGLVAAEEAVADAEDRAAARDRASHPRTAETAVAARPARAPVAAHREGAVEGAETHGGPGIVLQVQGTARGDAGVLAGRGGDDVDLVAGEGTVGDRHGGLAQVAEEAGLVLVRLDGAPEAAEGQRAARGQGEGLVTVEGAEVD